MTLQAIDQLLRTLPADYNPWPAIKSYYSAMSTTVLDQYRNLIYRFLAEFFLPTLAKSIGWRAVVDRFVPKEMMIASESIHSTRALLVHYLFDGLVKDGYETKVVGVRLRPDNMGTQLGLSEEELDMWWSAYYQQLAATLTRVEGAVVPQASVRTQLIWLLEVITSPQVAADYRVPISSMAEIDVANFNYSFCCDVKKFYVDPFTSPELAPLLERIYLDTIDSDDNVDNVEKFTALAKSLGVDVDVCIREILLTIRIYLNVPGLPELVLSFV